MVVWCDMMHRGVWFVTMCMSTSVLVWFITRYIMHEHESGGVALPRRVVDEVHTQANLLLVVGTIAQHHHKVLRNPQRKRRKREEREKKEREREST